MKKVNYLLPLLVVPFLFSCGNNGGKDTNIEFSLSEEEIEVSGKIAQASIDWEPSDHKVKFLTCAYTCPGEEGVSAEFAVDPETEPRPMVVKITFKNDITEDKDGTLSFTYKDVTSGNKEGKSSIKFTIPAPEPVGPEVTEAEFKDAIINKGETHCQTTFKQIKYTNEQETTTVNAQCSPGKSYLDMTSSVQGNMKVYAYALDDGINCKMTQSVNSGAWSNEQTEEIDNLIEANIYVTNESYSVQKMVVYTTSVDEIKFSDFKYENEVYSNEYKVDQGTFFEYAKITIRFANKKVAEYSIKTEREDKTSNERVPIEEGGFTCTYDKIDVVDPRI